MRTVRYYFGRRNGKSLLLQCLNTYNNANLNEVIEHISTIFKNEEEILTILKLEDLKKFLEEEKKQ